MLFKNKSIALAFIALLLLAGICCAVFIQREHCYYLKINGLRYFGDKDTITVGGNDHLQFNAKKIPGGLLHISHQTGAFHWKLSEPAYMKLNNVTVNMHVLAFGDQLRIKGQTLGLQQIKKITLPFVKHQRYFFVRDILDKHCPSELYGADTTIKSLLVIDEEKDEYKLIILDQHTWLLSGNKTVKGVFSGTVAGNICKMELVDVTSGSFIAENALLNNNNINVPAVRTEWQASHILFRRDSATGEVSALFAQPLVVAFDRATIHAVNEKAGTKTFYIAQEDAVLDKRVFYFENFSNRFPLPLLSIVSHDTLPQQGIISLNTRNPENNKALPVQLPLSESGSFQIMSPLEDAHVEALCELICYNVWDLSLPFGAVTLITVACLLLLYYTTNPFNGIYSQAIHSARSAAILDMESLREDELGINKTFWHLRLPVLLTILILMLCKLIIATKLCFTHSYFPQLYANSCLMACTLPVFVTWCWIKNSWSTVFLQRYAVWTIRLGRYSLPVTMRFLLHAALIPTIFGLLCLAWQLWGKPFYLQYFAAYDLAPTPRAIFALLVHEVRDIPAYSIIKQKYLLIPCLVMLLPFVLVIMDYLAVPVIAWCVNRLKRIGKKMPQWVSDCYNKLFFYMESFIDSMGVLILTAIGYSVLSKSYSLVYLLFIICCYHFFTFFTDRKLHPLKKFFSFFLMGIPLLAAVGRDDMGFCINFVLPLTFLFLFVCMRLVEKMLDRGVHGLLPKVVGPGLIFLLVGGVIYLFTLFQKPAIDEVQRTSRRVSAVIQKDDALATGGRQYLSDIQFLEIASLSASSSFREPSFRLVDKNDPFHPFISKGLYPIIINDLNPLVLLSYGGWVIVLLLVLSWGLLFVNRQQLWSANYELEGSVINNAEFNFAQLVRYLPVLFVISNSVWLLLSLYNVVFFTGRIVNGFGIDSSVDWFDMIILAACMGFVIVKQTNKKRHE